MKNKTFRDIYNYIQNCRVNEYGFHKINKRFSLELNETRDRVNLYWHQASFMGFQKCQTLAFEGNRVTVYFYRSDMINQRLTNSFDMDEVIGDKLCQAAIDCLHAIWPNKKKEVVK